MESQKQQSVQKLNALIKDVKVAMVTTCDSKVLRSRPMHTQKAEFDGDIWFFTSSETHKIEEIEQDRRVNISYAAPEQNTYVSVSGKASLVHDKEKIKELWNPIYKAWFPEGLDDPNLVLLKVSAEQAEYWDSTSNTIVQLAGFVKAVLTGERAKGGENEKIIL
ncbi:MAG: pyridoxamine 5'-phosphate oxidase family protein [Pseudomonadota bacterium]